ncbi:hypothetical protein K4K54_002497 [Colletotrichum sp. SAR 10_86]|nr:hypothetical protein K4K51_002102 [Colletotrichum sp. SAR 10_75]KAI8227981.1 hypothetical protein K4K54_002497 [Colletotrichum sp. SAR 10_86]
MVEPTYFLACPIFRDAGLAGRIRGAPEGSDGVDLDFLASELQHVDETWPDKTSGPSKSAKKRLVQLARKHDALLISDDVYDVLRWPAKEGVSAKALPKPSPRLVDVDRELEGTSTFGNAVSNGSFSKIVAPGMRLGWIEATPVFCTNIRTVGATASGGGQAHFSSLFVENVLAKGALARHINEVLIPTYQKRYYAMVNTIKRVLYPLGVRIAAEEAAQESGVAGGFFLYITFGDGGADFASEISRVSFEDFNLKIGPGQIFGVPDDPYSEQRGRESYYSGARLCWAWHEEEEIVEGIERLAVAIKGVQKALR